MPAQVGPFTVPNTWIYRSFVCIVVFFISRSDADANKKVRAVFRRLIAETAKHGWGEYRTHAIFQDEVRAQYSFNDHALLKFHERLKDAVDPNGIVAAGRSGIWPAHLRKTS
jgi:4-cresol dehydrogenase (hydroxylating)